MSRERPSLGPPPRRPHARTGTPRDVKPTLTSKRPTARARRYELILGDGSKVVRVHKGLGSASDSDWSKPGGATASADTSGLKPGPEDYVTAL